MLEDLEKKLYSQEKGETIRRANSKKEEKESVESGWRGRIETDFGKSFEKPLSKINQISKWFFWIVMPILILGIAGVGYYLYKYFSINQEINFSVIAPNSVMVGVPYDLEFTFDNRSKSALKGTEFSLFLPEGATILGESDERRVFKKEIGDLEPGSGYQDKIKLVIFGQAQEVKNFKAAVNYYSSLNTLLEKTKNIEISAKESGVKLDMSAPEKVLNNEEFEIIVNYANVSDFDFSGAKLKI